MKTTTIQSLDLSVGERATCTAGYPNKATIIVECIKDFSEAKNSDEIINNPRTFIKVVDSGKFGLLTSHLISSNWFNGHGRPN
jgi:hypothetical protein